MKESKSHLERTRNASRIIGLTLGAPLNVKSFSAVVLKFAARVPTGFLRFPFGFPFGFPLGFLWVSFGYHVSLFRFPLLLAFLADRGTRLQGIGQVQYCCCAF